MQLRLHMDHLQWGELQGGAMGVPRQADPDPAGLLRPQTVQPQRRQQAEHCLGDPLGNDLQVNVLANGRGNIAFSPHEVYMPSLCIAFTVISSNWFGDYVRARLDLREAKI